MFEFKKNRYTTKLIIELNNVMSHYNEICIEKTRREKTTKKQKQKFHGKNSISKFKSTQ